MPMSRQGISGVGRKLIEQLPCSEWPRLGIESSDSACGTSCCLVPPGPVGVIGVGA
jgi:hypothetical protein